MSTAAPAFKVDDARVVAAIVAAEQRTSGEIRVLVSRQKIDEPLPAAQKHFERLGMTKTGARNGVLIFISPAAKTFAVIGDQGVHKKCGEVFWAGVAGAMTECFKRGEFTAGLVLGIERAGALLAEHFPRSPDDRNEQPDAVERTD